MNLNKCTLVGLSYHIFSTHPPYPYKLFLWARHAIRVTTSVVHTILHNCLYHLLWMSYHCHHCLLLLISRCWCNLLHVRILLARAFLMSSSLIRLFAYPQCLLTFLPRVVTCSLALLLLLICRRFWAILWGVLVRRLLFTSYCLLDVDTQIKAHLSSTCRCLWLCLIQASVAHTTAGRSAYSLLMNNLTSPASHGQVLSVGRVTRESLNKSHKKKRDFFGGGSFPNAQRLLAMVSRNGK